MENCTLLFTLWCFLQCPVKHLTCLMELYIQGNSIGSENGTKLNYYTEVQHLLPHLEILDGVSIVYQYQNFDLNGKRKFLGFSTIYFCLTNRIESI